MGAKRLRNSSPRFVSSIWAPSWLSSSSLKDEPHGLAERYVQLIRTWARNGTFTLVEDWDYDHTTGVLSDTQLVCDWSAVGDSLKLPECRTDT